jgi:TonB dependent receptor/TonB-dependent Receptor Plug Domain
VIVNNRFLTAFFVFLFGIAGVAQDNEKQPLGKILKELEQRYAITFTYVDENIEGVLISPPSKNFDLSESLLYLQQHTGLLFQQLSKRYVTISKTKTSSVICGIISYADTGETVVGATIQVGNKLSISNEDGYFQLSGLSEDSVVHIRFVGYEPMDIPITEFLDRPCKKIPLQLQLTTLQEIFISDFITEGIDKKVDGSLVINTETLGVLPGLVEPDVLQAVQKLPGIQSINETISDINVRGGTNDQNLVLWDGIKMYHSGHFFGLISAYNPYLTEKVTLIKNGSSPAFGDGVSGTIDIRTTDQLAEKFSGGAGINLINGDVFAKVPLSKKLSLHVSARRSIADVLQTPTYKQYFERAFRGTDVTNPSTADTLTGRKEKFYFYDTSLKLLYNISGKDKLRVSFLNAFNDIEYQENGLVNNKTESKTSGLEQHNLATGISYSRLWNEKTRTSAQVYLSSYTLGAVNFDLLNDQRLVQENKVVDAGLKLDARVSLTNNIDLFTGYQFYEVGVTNLEDIDNPSFYRSAKKVVRSHAAFVEGNFTFRKTTMRVGVRSNYFPGFGKSIIEPRFSFNQNFLEHFSFELLGEMKSQVTTQIIDLQTDFLGVEKRRWVLSNEDDIPIIRSKQVSAGIYYKKNNLLISAEGYYKLVQGIITSSQGFQDQFQFVRSSGNYETHGVDFLISKKFNRFTTWLSYSNATSTFEFDQLIPPSFPNNLDITHRATFGCSYQINHFELSTGLNWRSGKPFTGPVKMNEIISNKINYAVPNSSRLDDYLRVDFSAKYRFPIGHKVQGQVGASLWNILNRRNIVNQYFNINDNNQAEPVQQASLGITPNIIFRIIF